MKKNIKGFTLLEVVVAIGLVVSGLISVLALIAQTTRDIRGADNRLIAAQLSQEAIEVVVAIRDANWINEDPWTQNIRLTSRGTVDYNSTSVREVVTTRFCLLRDATGYYIHGTSSTCNTIFSRHLEIADGVDGGGSPYREIKSVVEWQEGTRTKSVTVIDHLYDWYE